MTTQSRWESNAQADDKDRIADCGIDEQAANCAGVGLDGSHLSLLRTVTPLWRSGCGATHPTPTGSATTVDAAIGRTAAPATDREPWRLDIGADRSRPATSAPQAETLRG